MSDKTFRVTLPTNWEEDGTPDTDHAGRLHQWLAEQGYGVAGVIVHSDGTATVEADTDPAKDMPRYERPKSAGEVAEETRESDRQQAIATLEALNERLQAGQGTTVDIRSAVAAMMRVMFADTREREASRPVRDREALDVRR